MYVGWKRLFDDDIQSIAAETPQPAEPPPGKTSRRNIKSVPRKKIRGKRPTLGLGFDRLSLSTSIPEPAILSPSAFESIHQYEIAPEHEAEQHMPGDNVLIT